MDGNREITPYRLAPDVFNGQLPLTIPAAGAGYAIVNYKGINNFETVWGTPLELTQLIFEDSGAGGSSASDISVRLKMFNGRDFMNAPVHMRTMWGYQSAANGFLTAEIREPFFLFTSEYVTATFQKLSGGATTIRPYMEGVQYYPLIGKTATRGSAIILEKIKKWRERSRNCYPFWLTTNNPIVHVGNDVVQSEVKIADVQFEAFTLSCVSTGNFELEIKEVVTGQTLMNGKITKTNSLGDSVLPTILPFSYVLPRGAILRFTTTDLSGVGNTIYLTLAGRKINAPLKDFNVVLSTKETDIAVAADYERYIELETIGEAR
jgi:hypothetical protein